MLKTLPKSFFVKVGIILLLLTVIVQFFDVIITKNIDSFFVEKFFPPTDEVFDSENSDFYFSAFSDTGTRTSIVDLIAENVKKSKDKFVLQVGDMFRYRTLSHYRWMVSEVQDAFQTMPIYSIPGNHDINDKYGLQLYRSVFGQENYWFSYGNTLFVGINSSSISFSENTLDWLKRTLKRERKYYQNCIIFTHVPPLDPRKGYSYCLEKEDSEHFYSAIKDFNISMIICGHVHHYGKLLFNGIPLVVLPASGQKKRDCDWGFVRFHVSGQQIEVDPTFFDQPSRNREYVEAYINTYLSGSFRLFVLSGSFFFLSMIAFGISFGKKKN
ncbi:MAG: metallophosphoesterase [Lentisphaeria bacterium]